MTRFVVPFRPGVRDFKAILVLVRGVHLFSSPRPTYLVIMPRPVTDAKETINLSRGHVVSKPLTLTNASLCEVVRVTTTKSVGARKGRGKEEGFRFSEYQTTLSNLF